MRAFRGGKEGGRAGAGQLPSGSSAWRTRPPVFGSPRHCFQPQPADASSGRAQLSSAVFAALSLTSRSPRAAIEIYQVAARRPAITRQNHVIHCHLHDTHILVFLVFLIFPLTPETTSDAPVYRVMTSSRPLTGQSLAESWQAERPHPTALPETSLTPVDTQGQRPVVRDGLGALRWPRMRRALRLYGPRRAGARFRHQGRDPRRRSLSDGLPVVAVTGSNGVLREGRADTPELEVAFSTRYLEGALDWKLLDVPETDRPTTGKTTRMGGHPQ